MQLIPVRVAPCLESEGALEKAEVLNTLAYQRFHALELTEASFHDLRLVPALAKRGELSHWLRGGRLISAI